MRSKRRGRRRRHGRIRNRVTGTAARPRLCVFRSLKHISAQVVDDVEGKTLAAASTVEKALRDSLKITSNVEAARAVGKLVAERAKEKGIASVVFDRGGFLYHGRVKGLAEAARQGGLQF